MSYIGNEPIVSATRTITEVTATAGQTVFVANGGYTVGYIDVFLNGAQLQTVDFTATDGSSITLTEAAQAGDVIRLVAWGTFQSANHVPLTGDSNITGNINVSGNVGVGTTSPSDKLTVVSTGSNLARFTRDLATDVSLSIGADNDGAILEASGVNTLRLFTNASERMRIDASGRVTKPNTPAFEVKLNNSITPTTTFTTIVFDNVVRNQGSNYSSSTGLFTAPVAGVYHFSFNALYYPVSEGVLVDLRVIKNGSSMFELQCTAPAGQHFQREFTNSFYLAANDTLGIQHRTSSSGGNLYSGQVYYTGVLLG